VSGSALSAVIRRAGADPGESDAALLERFNTAVDHAAFAELVRRYARLVWALCRHSLPCDADADDAFQATFLALARHAKSVRDPNRLGPWLHTVAVRVCRNARRAAARRTKREARAAVPEQSRPVADSAWDAAAAAVHDEVAKLPAAQRVAFVLCVLEGKTPTAAALQLGLPVGTVGAQIHRAKEQLLKRLAARGLGASVAFATLLDSPPASAVERAASLNPTPTVLSLLPGAVPMTISHAKVLLVLAALTVGLTGLLLPTTAQDPPKAVAPKAEQPTAKLDLHGDPLPD
jgi:RNA polymerase sigma factor (sigma-70 family)